MSLEDAIRGNTAAIIALTEALLKREISTVVETTKETVVTAIRTEESTVEKSEPKADEIVTYDQVRNLVLQLAPDFRDEIKALNTKHGFKVIKDMLIDPEDSAKGVKDLEVFLNYYADLKQIKGEN